MSARKKNRPLDAVYVAERISKATIDRRRLSESLRFKVAFAISAVLTGLIVHAALVQIRNYHDQNLSTSSKVTARSAPNEPPPLVSRKVPPREERSRPTAIGRVGDPLSQVRTVVELAGALESVEDEQEIVPLGYYSSRDGSTPEETAEFFEKMSAAD